jgi:hypothetical protein
MPPDPVAVGTAGECAVTVEPHHIPAGGVRFNLTFG